MKYFKTGDKWVNLRLALNILENHKEAVKAQISWGLKKGDALAKIKAELKQVEAEIKRTKKEIVDLEYELTDEIGVDKNGLVWLTLPEDKPYKQTRKIGKIIREGKGKAFECWRNRDRDNIFRAGDLVGFNDKFMRRGTFTNVYLKLSGGGNPTAWLETTREFILANGSRQHWKKNQLELQIFLPIGKFTPSKHR